MRSINEQKQLEQRILSFLDGCDPMPCGVIATALCESAFEVRAGLHALVDAGELHKFSKPNGTEMFVVQSGGPGEAA
ncbi:hypothetical protein [Marinobacter sp. OP 3.4]|uniref:hypothetical protein n=1 Tax=Marinobacter sp. OP 3.4 TaxID=3076501 RepID=UPI002E2481A9